MLQLNLQNAAAVALLGVTTSTHRMIGDAMIKSTALSPAKFVCKHPQDYSIKRQRLNGEIYDDIVRTSCPMVYDELRDIWVCKRCGEELVYD